MQILTNHRPRSHITTTATNDPALWFSITARFHNTVVISYNIGVIYSTNDATSGDSELENEALEAEKRRKSLESKYEASLQEQIRMQMKVTKQSIPGPDRGDETIQRKGRDTRNSNKLI